VPWYASYIVPRGEEASFTINEAIKSIEGRGGRIICLDGVYEIYSQEIELLSGVSLEGQGAGTVFRFADGAITDWMIRSKTQQEDSKNISIRNLAIDGNGANQDHAVNMIYLSYIKESLVENLVIHNLYEYSSGIAIGSGSDNSITGTIIYGNTGITIYSGNRNKINDNKIFAADIGIFVNLAEGVVVEGNVIEGKSGDPVAYCGINLFSSEGGNVQGNKCMNCDVGISISFMGLNNLVTNNDLAGCGVGIEDYGDSTVTDPGNRI